MTAPRPVRPLIPEDYGVPGDASGAALLPWSWAEERLTGSRNYWICTTRAGGGPHASPVWGLWLDGAVWFSCGSETQKFRNLERDPRVTVHLESGDDVVVLEGRAERIGGDDFARFADAYAIKYPVRPPDDSPSFRVRPASAYTWREADFPHTACRWLFD